MPILAGDVRLRGVALVAGDLGSAFDAAADGGPLHDGAALRAGRTMPSPSRTRIASEITARVVE
jgi:hypothetical protein